MPTLRSNSQCSAEKKPGTLTPKGNVPGSMMRDAQPRMGERPSFTCRGTRAARAAREPPRLARTRLRAASREPDRRSAIARRPGSQPAARPMTDGLPRRAETRRVGRKLRPMLLLWTQWSFPGTFVPIAARQHVARKRLIALGLSASHGGQSKGNQAGCAWEGRSTPYGGAFLGVCGEPR
jgi:hypothetical protein